MHPTLCRLSLVLLSTAAVGLHAARAAGVAVPDPTEAERLVFVLEYIGADYGSAVRDGSIADALEYQEMVSLGELLVARCEVLTRQGAPGTTCDELSRLHDRIRALRPWAEIRSTATRLAAALIDRLQVVALPLTTPDPRSAAGSFAENCAPCHGPRGAGHGFADPEMDPPPSSFRDAKTNLLSPHQIYGAIRFGIPGTAMPSYLEALSDPQMWDLAFFVLTLRDDFAPAAQDPALELTLDDLVTHSNDELRRLLLEHGLRAEPSALDYLRQNPPAARPPALAEKNAAISDRPANELRAIEDASPFELALRLQEAFAAVAERVFPSVVTVTSFVRKDAVPPAEPSESWQVGDTEQRLYPGFRRLASGSGFFVSEDGYLLTAASPLMCPDGTPAAVLDVELPNGRHYLSRLVGVEKAVNLAVLQLEVVPLHHRPEVVPVTIGDSNGVQVGHWTIAVGDPWGAERAYAVGTLSAQPQRQCYQGDFTGTLMQSSVRIQPESYGGPLVDIRGNVVGISVPPPGALEPSPGASEFALPIDLAMNLYEALKVAESRRSPWLGFSVLELATVRHRSRADGTEPTLPRVGVYIDDRFDPSPASRADIRVGDSLVSLDGHRLLSVLEFQKWLYLSGIGRTVVLEIFRDGAVLEKRVTIEERPASAIAR